MLCILLPLRPQKWHWHCTAVAVTAEEAAELTRVLGFDEPFHTGRPKLTQVT